MFSIPGWSVWLAVALAALPFHPAHAAQEPDTLRVARAHYAALEAARGTIEQAGAVTIMVGRGRALRSVVARRPQLIADGLVFRAQTGGAELPPSVAAETRLRIAVARSGVGRGAKIGAIAGGVAGAVFGFLIVGVACLDHTEGPCSPPHAQGALVLGAIGAAGGALVGAGLGLLLPRWETVYDHPR